jgi:hypothetical protein
MFMTGALKKAFDELELLPEDLQNKIAFDLLEEVEWEKESYKTNTNLDKLATKAKRKHSKGKTHNIVFDEL